MEVKWIKDSTLDKYYLRAYAGNAKVATLIKVDNRFLYYLDAPDDWNCLDSENLADAKSELIKILLEHCRNMVEYYNNVITQVGNMNH